jgi:phage baseplate assembly protein gpV
VNGTAAPTVRVLVDGEPLGAGVLVLAVRVAARFNAPTQCELTLRDPHGAWPATARLAARLRVGVVGDPVDLFDGEVTCVGLSKAPDGATTTRVRGYDPLHRLRRRQTPRVLENVSATGVAVALTDGTALRIDGPDAPVFARVVQHRHDDLALLVETATRAGLLATVDGGTLRLTTLAGDGDAVPLDFGTSLFEVDVEANVDRAAGAVTAVGWDAGSAQPLTSRADRARSGRRIALTVPGDGEVTLVDRTAGAAHDLAGAAQLALDVRAAHAVVLRGTAAGDGRLRPGARIAVSGVDPGVDGVHVICEAVHTIDADGHLTAFSTEPPTLPGDTGGVSITLGRVLAVDDPDGRGRVRVALPAFGDPDIGWLGVVCPGAGRGKGLVALPDVGDTVAVAVPYARSDAALVLGSLYGAVAPPDPGVRGAAVRRWSLRTADGQSLVFDDDAHAVRLANRDGSAVELTPDEVRITAKTDLTIDASGHAVTIRSRVVDFERALG